MYIKLVRWKIKPSFDGIFTLLIFVPKIIVIEPLLLKLLMVVGWYYFFETQCTYHFF